MTGLSWIADVLAAVMIATAIYCAGRLVVARVLPLRIERDADMAHLLMGVAMAGMLVRGLHVLPDAVWEAVFAVVAAWFGWRAIRRTGHHLAHLVSAGTMVYMLVAVSARAPGGTGMAGMGGMSGGAELAWPALALALAVFMLGNAAWRLDRLTAVAGAGGTAAVAAPRLSGCCQIAMSLTMAYTLIMMM
jgi:hypothetical protein